MSQVSILDAKYFDIMASKAQEKLPIGERLAELRKQRGLTQVELGETLGVSQRMMAYYENDADNLPLDLLPKLADALGIDIEGLFEHEASAIQPKPSVNKKLWKRFEKIEQLSTRDQQAIFRMIDSLANQLK